MTTTAEKRCFLRSRTSPSFGDFNTATCSRLVYANRIPRTVSIIVENKRRTNYPRRIVPGTKERYGSPPEKNLKDSITD